MRISMLLLVTIALSMLVVDQIPRPVAGELWDPSALDFIIQGACSFLTHSLYNPNLGLVRETNTSSTYWISSDNILASRAIQICNPTSPVHARISSSMQSCCGTGYDQMHEAILGIPIPPVIHDKNVIIVANSTAGKLFNNITPVQAGGNYVVKWEVHNATGILHDTDYADVAVYNATEQRRENDLLGLNRDLGILGKMWAGFGINDTAGEYGYYQTYKTALYLAILTQTNHLIPNELEPMLLSARGLDGGFHTGYTDQRWQVGPENAETTAIVIIALAQLKPLQISIGNTGYRTVYNNFDRRIGAYGRIYNNETWYANVGTTTYLDQNSDFRIGGNFGVTPRIVPYFGGPLGNDYVGGWYNVPIDPWSTHTVTMTAGNATAKITIPPEWCPTPVLLLSATILAIGIIPSALVYRKWNKKRGETLDSTRDWVD